MAKLETLSALAVLTPIVVAACTNHHAAAGNTSEVNAAEPDATDRVALDMTSPRLCTIRAYASQSEPTKFAVGDYAVSSVSVTTASSLPLSKFLRTDDAGRPTEARFAISFRRSATQPASLLTPYAPLPLASGDATSLTFATPADTPGDDRSTLKVSAPSGSTVVLDFDETVHGHPGRTMTIECTTAT